MKVVLEYACMNGEFREGDEVTIDPARGIGDGDCVLFMLDNGRIDVGRVVVSPQADVPLLDTGDGNLRPTTEVEVAGRVIRLERCY